jgi:hypothetical protein
VWTRIGLKHSFAQADKTLVTDTDDSKSNGTANNMRPEIYRTILAGQERFAYFFLTASGSAIALAFLKTEGQVPACWMIPIGLAVLCWGISFYRGCEHVLHQRKVLLANWKTLDITSGTEPTTRANPEMAQPAVERLRDRAMQDNDASRRYGRQQYVLFLLGAVFYALAHVQHLCQ